MSDDTRPPREESEDTETAGYPTMPPLDAAEPAADEARNAEAPDSGWAGAARAAEEEPSRSDAER